MGWISELYLGAAHLFTWFYGAPDEIAEDPAYVPPVTPHQWWTREQNHQWLAAHGLESTGNASDLKVRVKEYIEQPGGPPPMCPPTGGTVKNVHNVVASLKAMVSRLMALEVTEQQVRDVDRHIKIFLSCFERLDRVTRSEKKQANVAHFL